MNEATDAMPGKLLGEIRQLIVMRQLRSHICDIHVEEDARGFGHTFSEDAGTSVLKVELALRDCLGGNDMSRQVLLESVTDTDFDVCRV